MSDNEQITKEQQLQQLHQELQNELTSTNQLLKLVSAELKIIKQLTTADSDLDKNVTENAALFEEIVNIQKTGTKKPFGAMD